MDNTFPVVGIGVSSDSRETLFDFFSELPTPAGIAYVVIQQVVGVEHGLAAVELDALDSLVSVDASDGTVLEPDHVYVLPAGEEFALHHGKLEHVGRHTFVHPLDRFLHSLAEDRTVLARGVLLSGLGDDGAEGLRAIRQHGGLSFALDPTTTKQGGMARHAIATHAVDFVLPLKRMAEQLIAVSSHVQPGDDESDQAMRERLAKVNERLKRAHRRQRAMSEGQLVSHEQLTLANEELSAANEELQVLNEELQNSREELLSTTTLLQKQNAALDAANDDLLNVLASVEIPIVIVDEQRRVRRYLRGASELLNVIPQDVGRPIADLKPKVEAPQLDSWIAQVIEQGRPVDFEARDERGRWRRLQIHPYRTRDDEIKGVLVSLVDIDALKRSIDDAKFERDRARILVETVPLPLVVLDESLSIDSANRSFYEFFGLDPSTACERSFVDLIKPREAVELRTELHGAILSGAPVRAFELACTVRELTTWVSLDARRLVAPGGKHLLLLVLQDVTERLLREQEKARAQAERMQRLLNEAGTMLLSESLEAHSALEKLAHIAVPALGDLCLIDVLGEHGSIVPAALAGNVGGLPVASELDESLGRNDESAVAQVIRSGRPALEAALDEAGLDRIGGRRATLLRAADACSYLCVPLQGRGEVLGALSLARVRPGTAYGAHDVALAEGLGQRAGMAIENARLYRSARDAVQLRDEFLGIASHELRTPLTALKLQLESLRRRLSIDAPGEDRGRFRDRVEHALRYSERLDRLIESLLVVSRIMASHFSLRLEEVDLGEITLDVVKRMRVDAQRAGCALELRVQSGVRGRWDPMRIDQIVSNLLNNAFRYACGAPVTITVEASDGCARLIVADAGPGIAPDRIERIFERYEIGSERSTSGLGLGLYIIRQIAEAHGGKVGVESDLGHGARFMVELPIEGPVDRE